MSKDECLLADWQTIGFEDGAAGRSPANIGERRRACAKHGVAPDMTEYEAGYQSGIKTYCSFGRGHDSAIGGYSPMQVCPAQTDYHTGFQQGLDKFCTYDSGYQYGLEGGNYRRTCPSAKEAGFLNGYDIGREIYGLQNALYNLQGELQNVNAARDSNRHQQDAIKQKIIVDQSLTPEQRTQLLLDIDHLRDDDDELEERKDALLVEITELEAQLSKKGIDI